MHDITFKILHHCEVCKKGYVNNTDPKHHLRNHETFFHHCGLNTNKQKSNNYWTKSYFRDNETFFILVKYQLKTQLPGL